MASVTLEQLWKEIDTLHEEKFPKHELRPIHGAGAKSNPRTMFIFINPTAKNSSTSKDWSGPRYPFIGTKQVWRIFSRAGLFDAALMERIETATSWSPELTHDVEAFLAKKGM